jgi:hypothetical protein
MYIQNEWLRFPNDLTTFELLSASVLEPAGRLQSVPRGKNLVAAIHWLQLRIGFWARVICRRLHQNHEMLLRHQDFKMILSRLKYQARCNRQGNQQCQVKSRQIVRLPRLRSLLEPRGENGVNEAGEELDFQRVADKVSETISSGLRALPYSCRHDTIVMRH